jgi:alpha-tubulin suppressor-like RCC1 family protein
MAACVLLCSSATIAAKTRVVAWGGEVGNRVLDVPYSLDDAVAISVPYVLRANGEVLEIGSMPPVVRAANAKAIAAAGNCLLVLRRNGTVAALGDASTCVAAAPADLSGVVAVATGGTFALALTSDGNVRAWGDNTLGQTDVPAGLHDVIAIAAGRNHALALRSDGQVVAWGGNGDGELDIPAGLANVVAIDVGNAYNLALRSDGTVVAWGDIYENPRPVPLDLPPARALGAGKWRRAAVVLRDGTVREWGFLEGKALPAGLDNVLNLSMGYTANFALVAGAITPSEAIADMRVDLDSLVAIEDADRSALNGYLDQAAGAVAANRTPQACEAIRSFAALVATPGVLIYPDRVTYFVSQSRDVFHLMRCGRWRDE